MKRLISIFISTLLIFSIILSISSVAFAAGELVRYYDLLDASGANDKISVEYNEDSFYYVTVNDILKRCIYFKNRSNITTDKTTFAYNTIKYSHASVDSYVMIAPHNELNANAGSISDSVFVVSGRYYLQGSDLGTDNTARRWRFTNEGSNIDLYIKDNEGNTVKTDVWYSFKMLLDLTKSSTNSNSVYIEFKEETQTNPHVISIAKPYGATTLKKIRIDMDQSGEGSAYWHSLKAYYIKKGLNKASLVNIDDDSIVSDGQNEVKFTLTEDIPDLRAEHVVVKYGDVRNEIASINSAADGMGNVEYTAVLSDGNFKEGSTYSLEIDKACYDKYRNSDADFTKVTTDELKGTFKTPLGTLGMMDAKAVRSDGGKVEFSVQYVNTEYAGDITFLLAIYDSEGRMVSINHSTCQGYTSPTEGRTLSWLIDEAKITGCTARVFTSKGWGDMSPMFSKVSMPAW